MKELTFGERLKYYLKYKNLTQKQISKEINISEKKISKLVTDKQKPTIEDLKLLSIGLELTIDQLIGKDRNFDEFLYLIYNIEILIEMEILPAKNLLNQKRIYSIIDERFYQIVSIDIYNKVVNYLDTVNGVKVEKTQEEIDKELAQLREEFPDAKDYSLSIYKIIPQIKNYKLSEFNKKWRM